MLKLASFAVLLLAAIGPVIGSARAHDNSRSRSLLVLNQGHLSHFVKLQAQSVWEVLPLDRDGNLLVEQDEFDAVQDDIGIYVREHVLLRADGGELLAGTTVAVELITDDRDALAFEQWIELELRYDLAFVPRRLEIEVSLFLDTSPKHQDLCDVVWADGPEELAAERVSLRFWAGDPLQFADSGRPPPTRSWYSSLWAGARAVLFAPLTLLCLAVLLAGAARVLAGTGSSRVLWAYALCLAGGVCLTEPASDLVTPAGASLAGGLAVAWVGALNLARRAERPIWVEAAVFGVLMGLGHVDSGVGSLEFSPGPPWVTACGATLAALLVGRVLVAIMRLRGPGTWVSTLVSAAAVFAGSWSAWMAV
jgi:hypothetical protein